MVAQVKPTTKNSSELKVGKNSDNLPAEAYDKRGVGEGLPAMSVESGKDYLNRMNMSAGTVSKGNYPEEKKDGVAQRGHGAATKGFTSRGPLA